MPQPNETEREELDRLRREVSEFRAHDTDRPPAMQVLESLLTDTISEMQGMRLAMRDIVTAVGAHTNEVVRAMTGLGQVRAEVVELQRWREDLREHGCGHPECPHRMAAGT